MRQAGRYLPEYRTVRKEAGSFLDLCYSPALAAEVTLQPLRRYDLDAAIIFADILVVPHAMGNGLRFVEGEGPVLDTVRSLSDLARLKSGEGSQQFSAVGESLARVKAELPAKVALIGFCGAPWTVASYMVEGKGSERVLARQVAYEGASWFEQLINLLIENSVSYLVMQVKAGAEVVQVFDSWAGDLAGDLFERFCLWPVSEVVRRFKAVCPGVPVIVFAKGAGYRHARVLEVTGCDAVGVEAETDLRDVLRLMPMHAVVQGNLDPIVLLTNKAVVEKQVRSIVEAVPMERHIFNLGHGIKLETDPDILETVIATVRDSDAR
jgi:uroporphyrinogen decarboxylase